MQSWTYDFWVFIGYADNKEQLLQLMITVVTAKFFVVICIRIGMDDGICYAVWLDLVNMESGNVSKLRMLKLIWIEVKDKVREID